MIQSLDVLYGLGSGHNKHKTRYSDSERLAALACDLVGNAVYSVVGDVLRAWRVFESPSNQFDIERKYRYNDVIKQVLSIAQISNGGVVVPRYKDTKLTRFDVLMPSQLSFGGQEFDGFPYVFAIESRGGRLQIDTSAVAVFRFNPPIGQTSYYSASDYFGASYLDSLIAPYMDYIADERELTHLLRKAIVDIRKTTGWAAEIERLNQLGGAAKSEVAKLVQQIDEATNNSTNHLGVHLDKDEEEAMRLDSAGSIGGLVAIPEQKKERFISASRRPRSKILGEQSNGLNNDSLSMRFYYDECNALREGVVYDVLLFMDNLVQQEEGVSFGAWSFGNMQEPTAVEKAEISLKDTQEMAIVAGIFEAGDMAGTLLDWAERKYGKAD